MVHICECFQRQPTELLPHLFIGDEQHSSNQDILDKIGITAILNVSSTCQSLFTSKYVYKVIPVQDKNNENILVWFAEAIQFIGNFFFFFFFFFDELQYKILFVYKHRSVLNRTSG